MHVESFLCLVSVITPVVLAEILEIETLMMKRCMLQELH